MTQVCKGVCNHLKAPPISNGLKYDLGYKRCTVCGEFFLVKNFQCPCCNSRLRVRARSKKVFNN